MVFFGAVVFSSVCSRVLVLRNKNTMYLSLRVFIKTLADSYCSAKVVLYVRGISHVVLRNTTCPLKYQLLFLMHWTAYISFLFTEILHIFGTTNIINNNIDGQFTTQTLLKLANGFDVSKLTRHHQANQVLITENDMDGGH